MRFVDSRLMKILRKTPEFGDTIRIEHGKRHAKLVHENGDWIPLCGSLSDHRAIKNFKIDLRRLITSGEGVIAYKTGRSVVAPQ